MVCKGISSLPIRRFEKSAGVYRHQLFVERKGSQVSRPVVAFFKSDTTSTDAAPGKDLSMRCWKGIFKVGPWVAVLRQDVYGEDVVGH